MRIEQSLTKVCAYPNLKKCSRGSLKGVYKCVEFEVWPISFGENFELSITNGPNDEREELKKIVLDAWFAS